MIREQIANQIRSNLVQAMRTAAETDAELLRIPGASDPFAIPADPVRLGMVRGYRYIKRNDAAQLGLAGELADSFDTEWFVDFEQVMEIRKGDLLRFDDGDARRVRSARGGIAGIYCIYRLEAS